MTKSNLKQKKRFLFVLICGIALLVFFQNCQEFAPVDMNQKDNFDVSKTEENFSKILESSIPGLYPGDFGLEGYRIGGSSFTNAESHALNNSMDTGFVQGITGKKLYIKVKNGSNCRIENHAHLEPGMQRDHTIDCNGDDGVLMTDLIRGDSSSIFLDLKASDTHGEQHINERFHIDCVDKPSTDPNTWICGVFPRRPKIGGIKISDTSVDNYEDASHYATYGTGSLSALGITGSLRVHFKALARKCYYIPMMLNGELIPDVGTYLNPQHEVPCNGYKDFDISNNGQEFNIGADWENHIGFVAASGYANSMSAVPPHIEPHFVVGRCNKSANAVSCNLVNGQEPVILGIKLNRSSYISNWFKASDSMNYDSRKPLRLMFGARAEKCWYGPMDKDGQGKYIIEDNDLFEVPCSGGVTYNIHNLNNLPGSGHAVFLAKVGNNLLEKKYSSNCKLSNIDGTNYRTCSFCEIEGSNDTCTYDWAEETSANYFE